MLRLLRFLIFGDWHMHRWETIREVDIYDCGTYNNPNSIPIANKYECRCAICGKIKRFRV